MAAPSGGVWRGFRAVGTSAGAGSDGALPPLRCAADADERPRVSAEDEAALTRVRRGDTEGYGDLVRRYQTKIYSVACGFVGPGEEALDLTQDVFVKAYAELAKFRGRSAFYTWLYRIAVNTCIDHTRKASRERRVALDEIAEVPAPESDDPVRITENRELAQAVERAMRRLSPKLRTAMILHDVQGLSMHEVAGVLGCRETTVRTRLFRARSQVRDEVRGQEEWRSDELHQS